MRGLFAWRWRSPDGRVGPAEITEAGARADAVRVALARPGTGVDDGLAGQLWPSLERKGWSVAWREP